jgi:hypothetical protein
MAGEERGGAARDARAWGTACGDVLLANRSEFDGLYAVFCTATEQSATDEDDLKGMGLTPRPKRVATALLVVEPPVTIDVLIAKKAREYLYVSAHAPAKPRLDYVTQTSPNPFTATSWVQMPGSYKRNKLTGPSGTQLWVRMAVVSRRIQSAWSTPVLVTIP